MPGPACTFKCNCTTRISVISAFLNCYCGKTIKSNDRRCSILNSNCSSCGACITCCISRRINNIISVCYRGLNGISSFVYSFSTVSSRTRISVISAFLNCYCGKTIKSNDRRCSILNSNCSSCGACITCCISRRINNIISVCYRGLNGISSFVYSFSTVSSRTRISVISAFLNCYCGKTIKSNDRRCSILNSNCSSCGACITCCISRRINNIISVCYRGLNLVICIDFFTAIRIGTRVTVSRVSLNR